MRAESRLSPVRLRMSLVGGLYKGDRADTQNGVLRHCSVLRLNVSDESRTGERILQGPKETHKASVTRYVNAKRNLSRCLAAVLASSCSAQTSGGEISPSLRASLSCAFAEQAQPSGMGRTHCPHAGHRVLPATATRRKTTLEKILPLVDFSFQWRFPVEKRSRCPLGSVSLQTMCILYWPPIKDEDSTSFSVA